MDLEEALTASAIHNLYMTCNNMREFAKAMHLLVHTTQETAMNAGIAASQTSSNTRVFAEIAKSISQIAQQMRGLTADLDGETHEMTDRSLAILRTNLRKSKYELALKMGCALNKVNVKRCVSNDNISIASEFRSLCMKVRSVQNIKRKLENVGDRVWTLAVNLTVESRYVDVSDEVYFTGISEALEKIQKDVEVKSQEMKDILTDLETIGRAGIQEFTGVEHAA